MLENVDPKVTEEIIGKAIIFYKSDPTYDNRPLIELLIKIKGFSSVF